MNKSSNSFQVKNTTVAVFPDERGMGEATATHIVSLLKKVDFENRIPVLWLMAAPSAFPFYRAFVEIAKNDPKLQSILKRTHFFQFDDYPVSRSHAAFKTTFRHLLETYFYTPLSAVVGNLEHVNPFELTNDDSENAAIAVNYANRLFQLQADGAYLIQLKGIGMDGHWGFHGAETALDTQPGIMKVPMNSQNIRQQMLDWPDDFPTADDVPKYAYTFNVSAFLKADAILDNVPQQTKEYAVLAAYANDSVFQEIPSSALKNHPHSFSYLTAASAQALLAYRKERILGDTEKKRLMAIWRDESDPHAEKLNTQMMTQTLNTVLS